IATEAAPMPLRDHFRPPLSRRTFWEGLVGGWPAMTVRDLNRRLPPEYVAEPRAHLGRPFSFDRITHKFEDTGPSATDAWPSGPSLDAETDFSWTDEYEVRVYDTEYERRLAAAVELVSPSNKDRPEDRRAFVAGCAALLQQGVSVAIVDLVTTR